MITGMFKGYKCFSSVLVLIEGWCSVQMTCPIISQLQRYRTLNYY